MKENKIITLYGFGYVGQAVWRFLKDHYEVNVCDPYLSDEVLEAHGDELKIYKNIKDLPASEFAIICVPTPMSQNGAADTSAVRQVLKDSQHKWYLIKSTVPPGTTAELVKTSKKKIAFSPEYIGEGKYEIPFWENFPHPTNMKLHRFHIFGGERAVTKKWLEIWQKVAGWTASYPQTDSTTAELVKYMANTFLATKKIFCDEFYNIAEVMGVDYNELKELWLLDGRVGKAMTMIFPDVRGFGGKCLPKDTNAIIKRSEAAGYEPKLLKQVLAVNKKLRKE